MPPAIHAPSSPGPGLRRWVWLALLGLVAVLGLVWAARTIGVGALMQHVILELRTMGAPVFFSAMAILPALGFPLLPFALAAGPVFSPVLGVGGVVVCAILAVSINVTLSYLLAATLLRPAVQWLLRHVGYALPDPSRHKAWFLTLLVRVTPGPPFWVQSYALGLVRVRFGAYLLVSTLVPAGYLTGAIVFGDAMMQGRPRAAMLAAGLIFLVGTGLYFLRKKIAANPPPAAGGAKP
jgi:uncharacterized membrane protein YdjX (TVP38/TMEM64 family)